MKSIIQTISALAILFLMSCGGDNSGLNITIHSPENNSTFSIGDTIVVSFTVTDDEAITTIAYSTKNEFGTGSVPGTEFIDVITEYSGEFVLVADVDAPGTYQIDINATDAGIENVLTESINVILE